MQRWRAITAGLTALALGSGLALLGASTASAEPVQQWGTFTLSGGSKAYAGTVTMAGFPATTFTSDSRQSTVVSGNSTWQSASTPPGQRFGTSRGSTYLNQRPLADQSGQPSTTTYTFSEPTPVGSWAFVLGDVDADQAMISATVQGGGQATAAQLGFQSVYNSCSAVVSGGWSCSPDPNGTTGRDLPTWDAASRTLVGNATSTDTAGATGWFSPTVPLTSLTITFERRSGFPVYQTWFASRAAGLTGTATLDGAPLPGATVTVTAPRGTVYTAVTGADGSYSFPALAQIDGYTVTVTPPPGADIDPALATQTADLVGTDDTADFPFTSPSGTSSIIGQVVDGDVPVADVPVTITDPTDPANPIQTTTNDAGVYTAAGLPPRTDVQVAVDGQTPVTVTTSEPGTAATPDPIDAGPVVSTVSGTITLDGAPRAGTTVELLDSDGAVVATTATDAQGRYAFATLPGTYTVRPALPSPDAEGPTTGSSVTLTAGATATRDFVFTTPAAPVPVTTSATGRVVDTDGTAVVGVTVTATPDDPTVGAPVTTTTDADGAYTLDGLQPSTGYTVAVAGSDRTVSFTSGPDQATVVTVPDLVVAAATAVPTPTPTPAAGPTAVPISDGGPAPATGALAYTGADLGPGIVAAGALVLLGAGLLTIQTVRRRRALHHQG
ncbi:hypothetical protein Csp2054_11320 [Curtobacterium sp. 'Ferrero']|uniref:MSCRAMM family protein n=1 Tax=Curtobacterium sp. 'Ferrero' TaxID=2033654 RepID=UPI000BC851E8|nr:carboxypeptidase-like regulatory domain-containing protein [Curtobacterium sp. 'Ferrero']PCN47690.1 hypothetical protein Csp2054_11320 [Curtobacterium sp. 'Ferrero']